MRFLRILFVLLVILAALLAINTVVLDNETKDAEATVTDGEILELTGADVQVVDHPATGSGPERETIVLLHCFGCSSQWWDPIIPLLNENHRVVTIDLIGHGGSEKPASGYEITAQSAAVGEALSELGVSRATVVGHSLGGVVAVSLAEQSSELVDRVVLIDVGNDADDTELGFTAKATSTPVIGEALWRIKTAGLVKSGYQDAFAPGFDIDEAFEDPDQVVKDNDAMTYTSYDQAQAEIDEYFKGGSLSTRLTSTGVPLLVINGSEDQILDATAVLDSYKTVPGARLEEIEVVGHSPNVEDPEATAALILPFAAAGGVLEPEPPPKPPATPEGKPGGAGEQSPSEPRPEPKAKKPQKQAKK